MSSIDSTFSGTGISLSSSPASDNFNNNNGNTTSTTMTDRLNSNSITENNNSVSTSSSTTNTATISSSSGALPKRLTTTSYSSKNNLTESIITDSYSTGINSDIPNYNTNNLKSKLNDTSSTKSSDSKKQDENKKDDEKKDESLFECNICLDTAKDAVVSLCGHLFCWPCLHQWLETRPTRKLCPVCKAAISKEKVIPLYGRNTTKQEDPRNKVPPRPAGQRTEPEPGPGFQGFGFGDGGFHMSFGIGAFPFGYFASSFNFGERRPADQRPSAQYEEEQNLSKIFLYLAVLCIGWLLFA